MEQTTTFNTRLATPEDVEVLEEAATDYANSMNTGCEIVNVDYALEVVVPELIANDMLIICECEGKAVGLVGAVVSNSLFNDKTKILQEMFWWTSKDSRNKGVGTVLLKELEAKAKQFEVDLISLSILDSSPKIGGWLKSNNYSLAESCYFKFLEGICQQ